MMVMVIDQGNAGAAANASARRAASTRRPVTRRRLDGDKEGEARARALGSKSSCFRPVVWFLLRCARSFRKRVVSLGRSLTAVRACICVSCVCVCVCCRERACFRVACADLVLSSHQNLLPAAGERKRERETEDRPLFYFFARALSLHTPDVHHSPSFFNVRQPFENETMIIDCPQ